MFKDRQLLLQTENEGEKQVQGDLIGARNKMLFRSIFSTSIT